MLCVKRLRNIAQRARSRNRSESCIGTRSADSTRLWRDRCDAALPISAGSEFRSRGIGDRNAARHFSYPEYSLERGSGQPRQIRATERTTSQSYRRTPTSIATYSVSRNPKVMVPLNTPPLRSSCRPESIHLRCQSTHKTCAPSRQPPANVSNRRTSTMIRRHNSTIRSTAAR